MYRRCLVNVEGELVEGDFMGIFQSSQIVPPSIMVGGDNGGVIAKPVAVVVVGKHILELRPRDVIFKEET